MCSGGDNLKNQIIFILLWVCLLPPLWANEPPRVSANGEVLIGLWEGGDGKVAAFKGVPFAAAPEGELRWQAPQAHQSREGEQQASEFAPGCMQGPHITNWYAGVAKEFGQSPDGVGKPNGVSEDCLYLNIWTPDTKSSEKLPVMVWVHGGSNKGGWSYEPNYVGDRLAAKGVIVVTIAYRLGVFGFFSHPALDNGPGQAAANFGYLDVIDAFQWVREHISAFGGDPNNITAIGESSGAGNIADFIVGEIAEDAIYKRTIIQSTGGSIVRFKTLAEDQVNGQKVTDYLGIPEQDLNTARLREIPADDLVRASYEALPGHYFDIVDDGLTFKERPLESFGNEAVSTVDILIGHNADEGYMYFDENMSWDDVHTWIKKNAPGSTRILASLVEQETDPRRAMDRLRMAKNTMCPSHYMAARISAAGGRGWVYYFSRQRPGPGGEKLGAYHGTEIGYVFDQHEYWQSTNVVDDRLTDVVMDYWVQFARTGDPNVNGRPAWPQYTAARPNLMELGDHVAAIPSPDADLCLWLGPGK
jgi:para-nitrobenzyl esterase